jgi:hypothetical protein
MDLLIVKIMVGKRHEHAARLSSDMLWMKVLSSTGDFYALYDVGVTRSIGCLRGKEPSASFCPSTRNGENDWPSIVVEVGVSKLHSALINDAHFWIKESAGMTWVVILIAINWDQKQVTMERWGHVPSSQGVCVASVGAL